MFTIDDGFIDHHDIAGPLFADYDIPLTFFLVTGFIDGELWPWDDQLSYAIGRRRFRRLYARCQGPRKVSQFARLVLAQGEIEFDQLETLLMQGGEH